MRQILKEKRRTLTALVAIAATVIAIGCGGDSTGPAPPQVATLEIVNASQLTAWYIYVRTCGTVAWGEDKLGDHVLSVGETNSWQIPAGCHDVRAETEDHIMDYEWPNVQLVSGQTEHLTLTTWTDAP